MDDSERRLTLGDLGKKRGQKKRSDSIEAEKGKEKQPIRRSSRAQSFAAAIQGTPSILEVLEANRKARRKAREDRESLRESGDYLGVQGINPQTGILDLTSDSGESTLSLKTEQKLLNLEVQAKNALSAAERKEAEIEIVKVHLDHEVAKARRQEKAEKQLAASATAKWRRGTHQWSSVQEPDLSPIAQSHRSTSVFSRRPSRRDLVMAKEEGLIDYNSKESSDEEAPPAVQPKESSNSSDTVVKTPHRRSLANPSPSAVELFENDIKFHNPSEPRLDRDQILESFLVPAHDDTQIQTPANETQHPQGNERLHEAGGSLAHHSDQNQHSNSFLGKGLIGAIEPGGTQTPRVSIRKDSSSDLSMKPNLTASSTNHVLVKSKIEIQSQHENSIPESYVQDLTTIHEKSITLPTTLEQTASSSLESRCQHNHQEVLAGCV
ncbi:hypothetical protein H9Q74_007707 [Fusarium xylarioides]|nr:hypothetical protein H9Q71_001506 [Fusarium xylarioides]KAG5822186.1 hypothetical protein H9Q74_007707 [Fusarium xylarioides]